MMSKEGNFLIFVQNSTSLQKTDGADKTANVGTYDITVTFETNGGNKIDIVKVSKNGTLSKPTEPDKRRIHL